jgi:hypothetical protein
MGSLVRAFGGGGRVILLAILSLVSACSSNSGGNSGSAEASSNVTVTTTPPPAAAATPPPAVAVPTGSYDTSVGTGVDSNGFAILPLRTGAHRYFVNSATGSDGNGCGGAQQPTAPLKTIAAAKACLASGSGDQMLIAEGTSYAEGLTNMMDQMGFSAAYPTVVQSYDPSDPLNEAKYGHAANGRRPVVNTGANDQLVTCWCGNTPNAPISFLAIRGLDFNPGNVAGPDVNFTGPTNYILIENNIFRYTSLTLTNGLAAGEPRSTHDVVRMNSFYGEWHPSAHAQGIYNGGTDGITIEDNVFWHNGWKVGVTRDEPVATGGPTMFRHPVYAQNSSTAIMYRRNLVIDAAADGGHLLGPSTATENVIIDCPIALDMTGGVGYETVQPKGVLYEASYNAIIGAMDLTSTDPRGFGIITRNGASGSSAHHNLLVRATNASGGNRDPFQIAANFGLPSYMDFHDNVSYLRTKSGNSFAAYVDAVAGSFNHYTVTNNVWDDPADGNGNRNVSSVTFPHPYTADELYVALGFVDRQTFINYAIEHPEAFLARNARALLFTGYGMN